MVLPGIQALFGFQLIAVFNQRFSEELTEGEKQLHYVAITLIVLAIGLIMTPAALHRQMGVEHVSEDFIRASTRLLLASMAPLGLAIALDFYLIGRLIVGVYAGAIVALVLVGLLVFFWGFLPKSERLRRFLAR